MNVNDQDMVELGELGEEIALIYFASKGCDVKMSDSIYDSDKDMIVDGVPVEIKTQTRLRHRNLFTTHRSSTNLVKCMKVEELIFVEFDESDTIKIWRVQDRAHHTDYQITIPRTKGMRGWYINKNEIGPGCMLLTTFKVPQITNRMKALSTSQFYAKHTKNIRYSQRV
jgi:hypothetical protein